MAACNTTDIIQRESCSTWKTFVDWKKGGIVSLFQQGVVVLFLLHGLGNF